MLVAGHLGSRLGFIGVLQLCLLAGGDAHAAIDWDKDEIQSLYAGVESPQYAKPESVTVTFGTDGAQATYSGLRAHDFQRFKPAQKALPPAEAARLLDLVRQHRRGLRPCSSNETSGVRYAVKIVALDRSGKPQRLSMSFGAGKGPTPAATAIIDALGALFGKKLREVRRYD